MAFLFIYTMIQGLHLEPTNICTLKCAECSRTKFIKQWPDRWQNHSLDVGDLMDFLDIDLTGLPIQMCGNYGDPIYHPRFMDLVRAIKNRSANITIVTNGSHRTREWWSELCDILSSQDQVEFSVDGTPENFTQYRENGDWVSIKVGMETCVSAGIFTRWKYIPFSYNEDTIDQARTLSQEIGINKFHLSRSWRFDVIEHLVPKQVELISNKKSLQKSVVIEQNKSVDPECAAGNMHFISATGHYVPCCMISTHQWYYKTEFGKNRDRYSIKNTTLTELLNQSQVVEFYDQIPKNPILACQYQCPKPD